MIKPQNENYLPEYNSSAEKLSELEGEYQTILQRLDDMEWLGVIGAFDKRTIIEFSNDVLKAIAQKYDNVQKGRLSIDEIAEYSGLRGTKSRTACRVPGRINKSDVIKNCIQA